MKNILRIYNTHIYIYIYMQVESPNLTILKINILNKYYIKFSSGDDSVGMRRNANSRYLAYRKIELCIITAKSQYSQRFRDKFVKTDSKCSILLSILLA